MTVRTGSLAALEDWLEADHRKRRVIIERVGSLQIGNTYYPFPWRVTLWSERWTNRPRIVAVASGHGCEEACSLALAQLTR